MCNTSRDITRYFSTVASEETCIYTYICIYIHIYPSKTKPLLCPVRDKLHAAVHLLSNHHLPKPSLPSSSYRLQYTALRNFLNTAKHAYHFLVGAHALMAVSILRTVFLVCYCSEITREQAALCLLSRRRGPFFIEHNTPSIIQTWHGSMSRVCGGYLLHMALTLPCLAGDYYVEPLCNDTAIIYLCIVYTLRKSYQ